MLYFLCQWHYFIPNFNFLAPRSPPPPPLPQLLPPLSQLTEISEMLTISNYYKPPISDFSLEYQPLSYLTSLAIMTLRIDFLDLSRNSDDII